MGAPSLPSVLPLARHFPQWSRTAILTITNGTSETDELKKSSPESTTSGLFITGDAAARVVHLEHSVRFLQEQHRLMLSGLHAEIEALRERNRDLQFQLIFNKETPKNTTAVEDESNEERLRKEVSRLEREASVARGEARAAGVREIQLQRMLDEQTEKLRELELRQAGGVSSAGGAGAGEEESRAELRVRLAEAERLVRRLRADAERQRREVLGGAGVTNLLFDGAAARHAHVRYQRGMTPHRLTSLLRSWFLAHETTAAVASAGADGTVLQCMKNSLHASLRASGLDALGYQNTYAFPPVYGEFWREPLREEYSMGSRNRNNRRPLTLPELNSAARSTVYANNHTRVRGYGYDKNKKSQPTNGETTNGKNPEDPAASEVSQLKSIKNDNLNRTKTTEPLSTYPELKIVVTKLIHHTDVSAGESRSRRRTHRKHSDHT
ncbi:unnamed protein product [Danaus chrysippus]|uniref:(African queen) hypothetical protein n=1 Tax=Danaus chrysippus TaxID=151541 RepID=A0A8J2W0A1_9NEOP|nr:unnamed protein product [Danaus chrysippus]